MLMLSHYQKLARPSIAKMKKLLKLSDQERQKRIDELE